MTLHVTKLFGVGDEWPSLGRSRAAAGIIFAGNDCWGTNDRGASQMSRPDKIAGLDAADAEILSVWLDRARAWGIDAVIDFGARCWRIPELSTVAGVFEKEKPRATWLIVRHQARWLLINCDGGFAPDVSAALPEILVAIDASCCAAGRGYPRA